MRYTAFIKQVISSNFYEFMSAIIDRFLTNQNARSIQIGCVIRVTSRFVPMDLSYPDDSYLTNIYVIRGTNCS